MDIVKQLRESCFCEGRGCELCCAAAEITQLRTEKEDLRNGWIALQVELGRLIPPIDGERANDPVIQRVARLSAELAELRRFRKAIMDYDSNLYDALANSDAARKGEGEV